MSYYILNFLHSLSLIDLEIVVLLMDVDCSYKVIMHPQRITYMPVLLSKSITNFSMHAYKPLIKFVHNHLLWSLLVSMLPRNTCMIFICSFFNNENDVFEWTIKKAQLIKSPPTSGLRSLLTLFIKFGYLFE